MLKRIKDLFVKIVYILNKPQKTLGIIVLIMTFLGALLECIGVSIIVPLVNVILNPNMYINKLNNPLLANMLNQGYSGVVIFVLGAVGRQSASENHSIGGYPQSGDFGNRRCKREW